MLLDNFVFGEMFTKAIEEWKVRTGKQQKEMSVDLKISETDISRYKKGSSIPEIPRLLKICEYMEVSPSVFGYDERTGKKKSVLDEASQRYSEDKEYMRYFIAEQNQNPKAKKFELSEDFLRWMKQLDYTNKMFPLYRDHVHDISLWLPDGYKRRDLEKMVSADVESPYQVKIEGKTYTLRYPDYAFISELQKYLTECAELFMAKRNWEMQLEDEEVNKRSHTKTEDGGTMFTPLSEQELQEIDPYRHHLYFKKEKRSK